MQNIYEFDYTNNKGALISFEEYKGKILLIVNTASKCGFTPQYEGLESLYKEYKEKGLEIIAFPCDQFGNQEPGSDEEIASFCEARFNTTFPFSKKIKVNGDNTEPVYTMLKESAPGLLGSKGIKWNFTKFLVNRNGEVIKRYAPTAKPKDIEGDVVKLL